MGGMAAATTPLFAMTQKDTRDIRNTTTTSVTRYCRQSVMNSSVLSVCQEKPLRQYQGTMGAQGCCCHCMELGPCHSSGKRQTTDFSVATLPVTTLQPGNLEHMMGENGILVAESGK